MSTNLDLLKIQAYSTALSSKLCNQFFPANRSIGGSEILSFTPVKQLNLLIVKNLLDRWKEELQKLKSPYFNYDSPEVKEALNLFMNTLSKNIAVDKEAFQPLVQEAVSKLVWLCLIPKEYLIEEFCNRPKIQKEAVLEKLKYHKVHETLFSAFQEQLGAESAEITKSELVLLIRNLPEPPEDELQNAQLILEELNPLLQFEVKDFKPLPLKTTYQQEAAAINQPFEAAAKQEPPLVKKAPVEKPLVQQKPEQLTINDALKPSKESSIADRFSKSKIEDIKSSIPLNLKFLFINILFDGNSVDYASALQQIEEAQSFDRAKDLLKTSYSEKYHWETHTEEAEEFLKIIERKFY